MSNNEYYVNLQGFVKGLTWYDDQGQVAKPGPVPVAKPVCRGPVRFRVENLVREGSRTMTTPQGGGGGGFGKKGKCLSPVEKNKRKFLAYMCLLRDN